MSDKPKIRLELCHSGLTILSVEKGYFWMYPEDKKIEKLNEIMIELNKIFPDVFMIRDERDLEEMSK